MALTDLKSNLSFYGKNPGPYTPNTGIRDTKYKDLAGVPSTTITGYSAKGTSTVSFRQVIARDSFTINPLDTSKGFSTRLAQLGAGSPFLEDVGWHSAAKYGDAVKRLDYADDKAILKSGLAFKYTANSPIDDQYNKFKVRDEAFNRMPYSKEPFILRGIQRNGKTKNQRFGLDKFGIDDGLVRGGILTRTQRLAIDALRLGKWLIKPKGIMWMAKQLGMQLTNPNTESGAGIAAAPFQNQKKIFTPINLLANVAGAPLGLRFQRHGIIPLPTVGRYEDIVTGKGVASMRATTAAKIENNRLNKLLKELQPSAVNGSPAGGSGAGLLGGKLGKVLTKIGGMLGFAGQGIKTLSGMTGPGSVYGIGMTNIRRVVDTSYAAQLASKEKGLDGRGLGTTTTFWFHDSTVPYFTKPLTKEQEDEIRPEAKDNLKRLYGKGPYSEPIPGSSISYNLTSLTAQLGTHTDNKFQDGTGDGITKAFIESYLTTKEAPYLGTNQTDGVIQPSTISTIDTEKEESSKLKQVKRLEDKEKGFKLTGLQAQLDIDKNRTHKSFRSTDPDKEDGNQPDNPYYAHEVPTLGTATKTPHQGTTPDEREDNINPEDKVNAKSLKKKSKDDIKTVPEENTAEQPASGQNVKPVQHYAALSYGKLADAAKARNEGLGSTTPNDFRKDITDNASTKGFIGKVYDDKGNESSYEDFNKEATYNYPTVGQPGRDRSNRYKNNRPDPINASPWSQGSSNSDPGLKDFINFKFYPIDMGGRLKEAQDPILFRAFIDSLSDNISPSWAANNDQGRADAKIMLESWERSIDLTFRAAAFSAAELQSLYNKMEALALCAYPDYSGTSGFVGRYVKIHIGNLYKNEPVYITSISFDWDNETPWELDEGLQVPYYTTVTLSLGWIGNMRPDAQRTKVFSVKSPSVGSKMSKANNYIGADPKTFTS